MLEGNPQDIAVVAGRYRRVCGAGLLVCLVAAIAGCASAERQFWSEEARILRDEVAKKRAELIAKPDDPGAAKAAEWLAKTEPILAKVEARVAELEAKENAEAADWIEGVGLLLNDVLPAPFNLAPWALAIGAGAWGRKKKRDGMAIARTIETVKKKKAGVVDFNDPDTVAELNNMGDGAKKLVTAGKNGA